PCRALCTVAVLAMLTSTAPRAMRVALVPTLACALLLLLSRGLNALLDALPALVAALVAWLFARTLTGARRPLIARAIAALDGAAQLQDPAIARYARRLTLAWALLQTLLALIAALLAVAAAGALPTPAWLPGPRAFGALVLPGAVLALLCGEFFL